MDCEKFESTLLDELYDELDEVTSAAAKRHVGGCARCASLLSGLKATRRVAVLPIVEPPAALEERIFAAAREAQKVVPFGRRASRAISWAGSWAMRPQTGMAAVFLLMTGMSALLLRSKHSAPASSMTVSEQGEPVASTAVGTIQRPPSEAPLSADKPAPLAAAPTPAPTAAAASDYRSDSLDTVLARGRAAPTHASAPKAAPPPADGAKGLSLLDEGDDAKLASSPSPLRYSAPSGASLAGAGGAQAYQAPSSPPVQAGGGAGGASQSGSGFNSAMASFNAGDYATATTAFDALASGGDLTSALWAARSVKRASGCAAALPRFEQVARAGAGTTAGYDATFESGECYRQLGQADAAQARFRSLITVPAYVDRAKNELAQMGPRPAAKVPAAKSAAQASPPATSAVKQQALEAK